VARAAVAAFDFIQVILIGACIVTPCSSKRNARFHRPVPNSSPLPQNPPGGMQEPGPLFAGEAEGTVWFGVASS
jgi:hypothetical protein